MDIEDIEGVVQAALLTAGFPNVLTREHSTDSLDQVKDLYFDKTQDPPSINYLIVTVKRDGSERYASSQVLELGHVDVQIFLAANEDRNNEAEMRQNVDTVVDVLDTLFTFSFEVDRSFPPVASSINLTNVKGFSSYKALASIRFEKPKTVVYN
jgi:hypothetical protein